MSMSERLQTIVRMVPEGTVPCDIGTDHGMVPIELVKSGKAKCAAACDILEGPLAAATENIEKAGLSDRISTYLSDGFEGLPEGLADTAIIAGMGGLTIIHIMEGRKFMGDGLTRFVLSPQSDLAEVRKYLRTHGISIKAEDMVLEDGKFYPVILAEKSEDAGYEKLFKNAWDSSNDHEREEIVRALDYFGPYLVKDNNPVLDLFFERKNQIFSEIENNLKNAAKSSTKAAAKIAEIEDIKHLMNVARRLKFPEVNV